MFRFLCCVPLLAACAAPAREDPGHTSTGPGWVATEVVTSYVSGTSPTYILGLDNNLEVCLALREPKSADQLVAEGTSVTTSQILLLRLWNLLERDGDDSLRCTLPVIEPPRSEEIAELGRRVASTIVRDVSESVQDYLEEVVSAGWPAHGYTLLGSFVLDGLVWQALAAADAIESADPSEIPSGSDQWSGVSWITLPGRTERLGTNTHTAGPFTLHSAWTPPALDRQSELMAPGLREALIATATELVPAGPHERGLRALGLVDGDRITVPVIRSADPLCSRGGALAARVAQDLLAAPDLDELLRVTGGRSRSVRLIMAYHWVYPEILAQLRATGLEPPGLLAGVEGAPLAPSLYVTEDPTACVGGGTGPGG